MAGATENPPGPDHAAGGHQIQIVTLTFYRFDGIASRLWAFAMMGLARPSLARIDGLSFWKICGAGIREGFTPRFEMSIVAILGVWPDRATAEAALGGHRLFARYRARASEHATLFLVPRSARGAWSGREPFRATEPPGAGPIAVLTRATLRKSTLHRFWHLVPGVSSAIGADPNVLFKIGLGEVPFLHQITFSIWPDARAMAEFARDPSGVHAAAVRAVRDGGWFREELYARFTVDEARGTWAGLPPIESKAA